MASVKVGDSTPQAISGINWPRGRHHRSWQPQGCRVGYSRRKRVQHTSKGIRAKVLRNTN